ncbi:hypothetical protein CWATWH0005_3916 [Crocosphaera watsonii WH 0005]|uniref:Uncharacterized protein n=1 Tax=Crocosphaera watsonii WH 0005 TaxID=423472 RepID=T2IZ65_CROWT|nr:hypothetical protein CWATWH0005_3916 [Crocosphaera watsonii WH 0005]
MVSKPSLGPSSNTERVIEADGSTTVTKKPPRSSPCSGNPAIPTKSVSGSIPFSPKMLNSPKSVAPLSTKSCRPPAGIAPVVSSTSKKTVNSSPSINSVSLTERVTVGPLPGITLSPSTMVKLATLFPMTLPSKEKISSSNT